MKSIENNIASRLLAIRGGKVLLVENLRVIRILRFRIAMSQGFVVEV
jgi:hypothetical protein